MECLNNCSKKNKHKVLRIFFDFDYDANKIFNWVISNKEATNNNVYNNIYYFCANCEMASIIIEIALLMFYFSLSLFKDNFLLSAMPFSVFLIDLNLFIKIASVPLSNTFSYLSNGIKYYISTYFFALSIIIALVKNNSVKSNSYLMNFIIQKSGSVEIILLLTYIIGVLFVIHRIYPTNVKNKKDLLYVKPKGYKYFILWIMRFNTVLFSICVIRGIINLI